METGIVDILVLFYNKIDQTISCVNSFLPSGQQIYVLNNGSDEKQFKKLKLTFEQFERVHILESGKNLGVSGGRNFLIKHTEALWLFLVDNDISIRQQHNWLEIFKQFLNSNSKVKIVSPLLYNVHEQATSQQLNVILDNNRMHIETGVFSISNCFPGGASLIHRCVFETYGVFDELMFVGFEDYEFALRAMISEKGPLQVYTLDTIELIHDHQFQKSSKDKEAVRQRYNKERMEASYDRLVSKYGINFDHDWRWWTNNQLDMMTEPKLLRKFKHKIRSILSR